MATKPVPIVPMSVQRRRRLEPETRQLGLNLSVLHLPLERFAEQSVPIVYNGITLHWRRRVFEIFW